jgi:hypothetical protein
MTPLGWVFMLGSAAFVWGLTIWCFWRVLSFPDEPPAEQVKEFHSA